MAYFKLYSAPLASRLEVRAPYYESHGSVAELKETNSWKYKPSLITNENGEVIETNGIVCEWEGYPARRNS